MPVWIQVLTIIFGTAVLSFVQFLITRRDSKHNQHDAIIRRIDELDNKIDAVDDKIDRMDASNSRRWILRYSQEVRRGIRHTKEDWDQINLDIDEYKMYCKTHPNYENSRADLAIRGLHKVYMECWETDDFELSGGEDYVDE